MWQRRDKVLRSSQALSNNVPPLKRNGGIRVRVGEGDEVIPDIADCAVRGPET
jgi:hypothetical protein